MIKASISWQKIIASHNPFSLFPLILYGRVEAQSIDDVKIYALLQAIYKYKGKLALSILMMPITAIVAVKRSKRPPRIPKKIVIKVLNSGYKKLEIKPFFP